jgi:glycosyltransferase involved in cell wall biosynthesis
MSHHLPKVTVVIPAYNAAPWLPTLFEGLDQQTFRDFEVIFVNDGSTDNTGALLDAYAMSRKWVKVLHQKNKGPSAARNIAIEMARGSFIVCVDADDAIAPSHLDDLYSLATSLNLDVAMCNGWRFRKVISDADRPIVTKIRPERVMTGAEWFETTFNDGQWWRRPWMMMVRKDLLKRHSISFVEGIASGDSLWNAMLQARAMRVAYTPKQSYYYRRTPGSIQQDQSIVKKLWRIESNIVIIKEMWKMADSEMPHTAILFKRAAAYRSRKLLRQIAELPFRQQIAISRELLRMGFLSRMFREVETGMHRKKIARAYWFAWLGTVAEALKINKAVHFNLIR